MFPSPFAPSAARPRRRATRARGAPHAGARRRRLLRRALGRSCSRAARRDGGQPYRPLDVFADVLAFIENGYVEDVKEKELVYGAIEGMVARLDPHSQFMRPEVFRALKEETTGEFDGVGLELGMKADELVVVAPIADAPAEQPASRRETGCSPSTAPAPRRWASARPSGA